MGKHLAYICPRCQQSSQKWIKGDKLPCDIEAFFKCKRCDVNLKMVYYSEDTKNGFYTHKIRYVKEFFKEFQSGNKKSN